MEKTIFLLMTLVMLASCGNSTGSNTSENSTENQAMNPELKSGNTPEKFVEILYFHGKKRCATCLAIEKETKAVTDTALAEEISDGSVVFRSIDLSEEKNSVIAEKYGITWSSLVLVNHCDGKETYEDMTRFAFATARNSPAEFRDSLTTRVREMAAPVPEQK